MECYESNYSVSFKPGVTPEGLSVRVSRAPSTTAPTHMTDKKVWKMFSWRGCVCELGEIPVCLFTL